MNNQYVEIIPDGGWGWIVVGAVALINMTNQSITSVFGLLFGSHLESIHQGTSAAALITNLNSLALNFSGLFIGPAIKSLAPRKVAIIGCLFVSFGLMTCSIATNVWHLIAGYSFFIGIGLGMIAPSNFLIINAYFSIKRGRAVGIALAGGGLGQMIIPHIVRIFLDNYGFQAAVSFMAVFSLIGVFGAAMFRPLSPMDESIRKHNNRKNIKLLLETRENDLKNNHIENVVTSNKEEDLNIKTDKRLCVRLCNHLIKGMDLKLLLDPNFWSIIFGIGLVYTTTVNFSMILPYFLQSSVGLSRSDTASCMSAVAFADIVCRLVLPIITDKLKIPYRIVFLLGTIGLLISRAALAESVDIVNIIAMSVFSGMAKSATVLNNNLAISEHCRKEQLAGGLGLNMISKGILVITVGQLLGWIRDYTNSYTLCIHAQNTVLLIVIIVWTLELTWTYFKTQSNKQKLNLVSELENGSKEERTKMNNDVITSA